MLAIRSHSGERQGTEAMDENQQLRTEVADQGLDLRLRALWERSAASLAGLSSGQRRWALLAGASLILAIGGLVWFAARPDWRVLYAGLDPQDAREIAAGLTAASLPFDVSPDGATIRVPSESLDKARLATTAKGRPKSGRMGFELFDKPNWIGSEFEEKVNYQRALEGEIEHTIDSMGAIQSSRVNLVMPHDSLFTDQQREAKASVVLKMKHRSLNDEEGDAIRNLVASAVDGLTPDKVILADADGHAVLGRKSASAETEAHEQQLEEKLIETLEPVAGVGNVRASVNVDYDSSISEETDETYDPASVVTLSMQKSQQTSNPAPSPAGVPGTASNAPNAQPPLFPTAASSVQSTTQENGTYGASKRTRRLQQGIGRVRRVTAAILVNDRKMAMSGKSKQTTWQPRNPEEMKRLTMLAQAAIGYDTSRGDQISLENISFDDNNAPPPPSLPERLLKSAGRSEPLLRYATILAAMLGLVFFVIRPIAAKTKPLKAQAAFSPGAGPGASSRPGPELPEAKAEELLLETQKKRAQSLHEGVVAIINRDPALSSRLLHSWIHVEGG
ncbi:Flagellar M-ring protein FliF [Acidisarcina polymorpha]|uniref:Flagellar M-ring protein n=1 Tax=Acidisarcina polymorpha TaxID=2211140 RepID=A0A2Z5FS22_9BACT|nr:flagellar basal-body MS-ring/collar protein FliF [Acidisarcina polymorpha]AXC09523.1 Flagellar M-ring protein FliF [Acidisarcina polymorpha]